MKGGLGQMPLTLFVIVAAVVVYLYIRRAHLGIDRHPGETVKLKAGKVPPGAVWLPQGPGGVGVTP